MKKEEKRIAYSVGNGIHAAHYLGIGYNEMIIEEQKAEHIGVVGFWSPWEGDGYDFFDDLWGTPDGKRYVERYITQDIVPYNWTEHGYIWTNKEIHKASMGLPVTTIKRPHHSLARTNHESKERFEWCPDDIVCKGNCPKEKCFICPCYTWEYGPNEDFFPTEQDLAEDHSLRVYIDPREYRVKAIFDTGCTMERNTKKIEDAINIGNEFLNMFNLIKIEIQRVGNETIVASIEI